MHHNTTDTSGHVLYYSVSKGMWLEATELWFYLIVFLPQDGEIYLTEIFMNNLPEMVIQECS